MVCFLGTLLHSCASLFLKIRNPKSQSTNLAGSLDGAPIITQSRRHKPCSKIEVSYSAHSQLAFDASLLFTDCQRDCDCDLRFARCCAAAVRSHNNVGDAIRIDDLRGIKIPYYDGNPSNLDDFILDWEDFAEEVVGEMRGAPRDKWVCRTFPHWLAQDLKEELRDQIREGLIRTEQACLQWLEDEERVDAPNQKLEDLWSIPLPLDRGELRVREWNRYLRKYRRSLKPVEDWNESSEIRHLLKDVLPGHWKKKVEDEEKKQAKKRVAVRIMAAEDTHAGIMEFFRRNLGEPNRMLGLKNAVELSGPLRNWAMSCAAVGSIVPFLTTMEGASVAVSTASGAAASAAVAAVGVRSLDRLWLRMADVRRRTSHWGSVGRVGQRGVLNWYDGLVVSPSVLLMRGLGLDLY